MIARFVEGSVFGKDESQKNVALRWVLVRNMCPWAVARSSDSRRQEDC